MTLKSLGRLLAFLLTVGGVGYGCGGASQGGLGNDGGLSSSDDGAALPPGSGGVLGQSGASGAGGVPVGQGGAGGSLPVQCGDPGTQCCDGNGCNSGGCCVSGICMAAGGTCIGLGDGVCSAGACGACGGLGLSCCATSTNATACTATGTRCSGGFCAKCGDLGGPCCLSASGTETCSAAGAICISGLCTACGTPGTPCCPGNQCGGGACCYSNVCVSEATACGANGGLCQAGRCSGCGSQGQPCCSNLCYDSLLCKDSTCTPCGAAGQTCCPAGGSTPQCQAGNACTSSGADQVCARCGSLGDTCCAGNACSEGCCSGGRCVASSGTCPTADASVPSDAPVATGGGGTTGSGGAKGTGGATSSGGVVSSGGVKSSGGVIGSGGVVGSGGITGTGGSDPCGTLIDNMESGTGKICQTTTRRGMWFTYVDTSTTSSIAPAAGTAALPQLMSTSRTSTSSYAMHISGYYSTYAGIGCWLNNLSFSSVPGTYNANAYTGIHFYAKGSGSLIVVGQMPSTESTQYGGTCSLTSCAGNSYKVGTLSSSSWAEITVPFSSLTGGSATPFSPSSIWSLEFQYYSSTSLGGVSFDLWIDDLSFY